MNSLMTANLASLTTLPVLVTSSVDNSMTRRQAVARLISYGVGALTVPSLLPGCSDDAATGVLDGGGLDAAAADAFVPPSSFSKVDLAVFECRFVPDIDRHLDIIRGVCTTAGGAGVQKLFEFDPNDTSLPIDAADVKDFGDLGSRTLNNLAKLRTGRGIIMTDDQGGLSGFYEFNLDGSGGHSFVAFPPERNFGGGAVLAEDKLFIPTANFRPDFTYAPGTVLVYNVNIDGTVNEGSRREIQTSGLNPTGIILLQSGESGEIAVLNSGDFSASAVSAIDIIDADSENIKRSISLNAQSPLTAQISGELALTADGRLIIGTADNTGRLLIVHLDSGAVSETTIPGTAFHTSTKVAGNLIYVTDFNSGTVNVLSLLDLALLQSISVASGEAGPSEIYNGSLIQVVPFGAVLITPEG